MTKRLMVGDVAVGGGAPVSIQSMCNTKTDDVRATVEQIHALEAAGCEIIRIAIPDQAAAEAVDRIKEQISIPLIADIHFNYKYALACAERGSHWAPVTWMMRGLSWGRPLASKIRFTAVPSRALAPRPYTVSVGMPTRPPSRRILAAAPILSSISFC